MTQTITDVVREKYASVADSTLSNRHEGVAAIAHAFGYSPDDLDTIPADANMGLSCGNPVATASLRAGETVVDLGCGGGLDVFLAARHIGPTGRAIGIDMTPEMIARAQRNAQSAGVTNVEFHRANINALPLSDSTVDCVISNCVINLAEDKPAVFREMARVLKPGGRLAISDIALKQPLPDELRASIMAYVGCIAGAILIKDYEQQLIEAGFQHVQVVDSRADLNAYAKLDSQSACCSPAMTAQPTAGGLSLPVASTCCSPAAESSAIHDDLRELLQRYDVNEFAASVKVFAVRPNA